MPSERLKADEEFKKKINDRNKFLRALPPFLLGMAGGAMLPENVFQFYNVWENPLPLPDPNASRFLLLADIHAGDYDSGPRQTNSKSFDTLRSVLGHLRDYPFDKVIQMGDLIKQETSETKNIINYKKALNILDKFPVQTTHLLGNHDVWGIPIEKIAKIHDENKLNPMYGVYKYDNFQIVWLDLGAPREQPGFLPKDRIDWLKNVISEGPPTIIFSHYPILPQDPDGNYYFEGNSYPTSLTNGQEIWKAIKDLSVFAIVNAHMHWSSHEQVDKTHIITVPSFLENIVSTNPNENPGVYSILEVNFPKKFVLKSYFGSICFSRIQITPPDY